MPDAAVYRLRLTHFLRGVQSERPAEGCRHRVAPQASPADALSAPGAGRSACGTAGVSVAQSEVRLTAVGHHLALSVPVFTHGAAVPLSLHAELLGMDGEVRSEPRAHARQRQASISAAWNCHPPRCIPKGETSPKAVLSCCEFATPCALPGSRSRRERWCSVTLRQSSTSCTWPRAQAVRAGSAYAVQVRALNPLTHLL